MLTPMPDLPTRERLIAEATRLLARSGYRDLGVNELLESADATAGSLYHHFPGGKQELAAHAIREAGDAARAGLDALLAQGSPGDAIRAFFGASGAGLETSAWQLGCPVGTPAADGAATNPEIAAAVSHSLDSWVEALGDALRARGVADAPAREFGSWAVASYEGALLIARTRRDTAVLHAAASRLAAEVERLLSEG